MSAPATAADLPPTGDPARPAGPGRRLVALGALLSVAWIAWLARLHAGHWVDDAYIGFRYAENLRAGLGFVWNPGEPPVEGITNLGWTVLLVPFAGSAALPGVAKLLGLALLVAALWLTARAHRIGAPEASALERALVLLLLASQAELVYYSIAGMETGLAAALVAGYLLAAGARRPWLAGGLAGALLLVRPEAVLLPLLHVLLAARPRPRSDERRALARGLGVALAVLAAATAWRLASFGAPWPNTFVAKPPGTALDLLDRLLALLAAGHANLPVPYTGLAFLALAPLGWLALRRKARALGDAAAAATLTGIVFALYAPADWTETGRFFAPYVPAAALVGARGAFVAAERLLGAGSPRRARALAAALVLAAVAGGLWRSLDLFGPPRTERRPGYVIVSETLLPTAEHLARTLPRDATIASRRLGALGYFTGLAIFDYSNGLTDAAIARLVRENGAELGTPRHPLLAEVWRRRAPEYLLEDLDVVADWLGRGETPQAFAIHGIPYRLVRSFPLGDGRSRWALIARADAPVPPPLPEPRALPAGAR